MKTINAQTECKYCANNIQNKGLCQGKRGMLSIQGCLVFKEKIKK